MTFGAGTYNVAARSRTAATSTFGAGTYNVADGIIVGGGSTTSFRRRHLQYRQDFRAPATARSRLQHLQHRNDASPSAAPAPSSLAGGIYNGGGATLTDGQPARTANSYNIGAANDGILDRRRRRGYDHLG